NAAAVVDHADATAAVACVHVDFDAAAAARELGRVRQQVRHDLVKAAVVDADQRAGSPLPRLDDHAQTLRVVAARGDAAVDQIIDNAGPQVEAHLAGRGFLEIENVVDQLREPIAVG